MLFLKIRISQNWREKLKINQNRSFHMTLSVRHSNDKNKDWSKLAGKLKVSIKSISLQNPLGVYSQIVDFLINQNWQEN